MILDILSKSGIFTRRLDISRLSISCLVLIIVGQSEPLRELKPVPDIILSLTKYLRVNCEM